MPPTKDTKGKILDAAEALFADGGMASTSLRAVTAEAGVNLAAVNYHFGSKEALIEAVFDRRLAPLNRERLARLDALEADPATPPSIEALVEAFIDPVLRLGRDPSGGGRVFMRLMGHAVTQPAEQVRELFAKQFREVAARFVAAISRAVPELPLEEVYWRLLFMGGAMAHATTLADTLASLSGGACVPPDVDALERRLVPFLSAGLRAPGPDQGES